MSAAATSSTTTRRAPSQFVGCPRSCRRPLAPAPGLRFRQRLLTLSNLYSPSSSVWGDGLFDDHLHHGAAKPHSTTPDNSVKSAKRTSRAAKPAEALVLRTGSDMETVPLLSRSSSYSREAAAEDAAPKPPGFSWQHLVALCTLSIVICYADRSNISTAVLPMAEQFGWDKAYQGVVLSVFFGGYATTQILGGKLADQFGGKLVLAAGVALWSLFTFLTPGAAAAGAAPLLAARVMLGVGEGVAFPSIHSLISRNVPARNRTTAVGIVTAASYAGTALAFGVSPLIISRWGWEWVFYAFAGLALLWLPLWAPVRTLDGWQPPGSAKDAEAAPGALTPGAAADALEASSSTGSADSGAGTSGAPAPAAQGGGLRFGPRVWALLKRREVLAICVAQYTQSWGMYGLLNWLPTFFSDFYKVELADLGAYTLLPYVVQGGLGAATGVFADRLLQRGFSVRSVRRVLQVVGMLGPAACLLLAVSPAVGASAGFASNLITLGLGFSALSLGGVSASHLDIAPRNAGLVFGAGNTAATLAGLISVPVTGYLLQSTGSWPLVFGITAAHYVVGAVIWAWWVGDRPLPEDEAAANDDGGSGGGGAAVAAAASPSS